MVFMYRHLYLPTKYKIKQQKIHLFSFIVSHFPQDTGWQLQFSQNHKKKTSDA